MGTQVVNISERIIGECQIAATTSATSALALPIPSYEMTGDDSNTTLIVSAVGADITFNFGNSTVQASTTVDGTTKRLPAGNFTIASGKTYSIRVNRSNQNYVSVKTASGSGTAVINTTSQLQ